MRLMIASLTGAKMWVRDDLVPIHLAAGDKLVAGGPAEPSEAGGDAGEDKETGTVRKTPAKRDVPSRAKKTAKKPVKKPVKKPAAKKPAARKPAAKVEESPKAEPEGEGDGEW